MSDKFEYVVSAPRPSPTELIRSSSDLSERLRDAAAALANQKERNGNAVKPPQPLTSRLKPAHAPSIKFPDFSRQILDLESPEEEVVMKDSPSVHFSESVEVNTDKINGRGFEHTLVPIAEDSEESLVWVSPGDRMGSDLDDLDGVTPAKPAQSASSTSIAVERDDEEMAGQLALRTRTMSVINFGASGYRISDALYPSEELINALEAETKDEETAVRNKEVARNGGKKSNTVDAESMTVDDGMGKPCQCWKYCSCRARNTKSDGGVDTSGVTTNNVKGSVVGGSPGSRYSATYTFVYEPTVPM